MADQRDLLFELGTEELPPKSLRNLRDSLRENFANLLRDKHLDFEAIHAFASPRRLSLLVEGLATAQPDTLRERKGPALSTAFDSEGLPSKAALGFARSCGVAIDELERESTPTGSWLVFRERVTGGATSALIPDLVKQSLERLPIAKRMRWADAKIEFVRPVHWSILLYGNEVIPAEILGTTTGNLSHGHRVHAPHPIRIDAPQDYLRLLKERGSVIADFDERRAVIHSQVEELARGLSAVALIDPDLLDEITALAERPVALCGSFDARYLKIPPEVLISTMQTNQKYVPLTDSSGQLLAAFIAVANLQSSRPESVIQGNERVIRPRFSDAEFFWNKDRQQTLESRVPKLNDIVFQQRLGSLYDKSQRVLQLARSIAERLELNPQAATRAALLAKADLLTEMVAEFPALQGVMGRYYALHDGENAEVARAIEEQYFPKQAGGALPETKAGQVLAIAEKMDSLAGIFSVGLVPTGDKDPYALRRAALGLLRILIEKELDLDLCVLLDDALALLPVAIRNQGIRPELLAFLIERLRSYCLEQGFKADEFEAVLAVAPHRPLDFVKRLKAVAAFRSLVEAESLASANKRIRNILRKAEIEESQFPVPAYFAEHEERQLFEAMNQAGLEIGPRLEHGDYTGALTRLSQLRETVDCFFDRVMVMAEDVRLRDNRLALLARVQSLFLRIADISRLQ